MKIILMGPPGSGKGTQAKLLCEHYGIVHISTGDLLRAAMQEDSPKGRELKELMGTGNLIADSVVLRPGPRFPQIMERFIRVLHPDVRIQK